MYCLTFRYGRKHFVKIVTSFAAVLSKMFLYLLYIYKKPIIVSLFNIDTLNFTMYILANLAYPLKTYVRLSNLI